MPILFSFDPPPDFDEQDDPAVVESERLFQLRVLRELDAIRFLLEHSGTVFDRPADVQDQIHDALRTLLGSAYRRTALVVWTRPITENGADRLAANLGGTWEGPELRGHRCGDLRVLLAGSSVETSPSVSILFYERT